MRKGSEESATFARSWHHKSQAMRWVSLGSNHLTIHPEGTEGLNRMSNADHPEAVVVGRDRAPRKRGGAFSLVPGFFYILILYIIGKYVFADPRGHPVRFPGVQALVGRSPHGRRRHHGYGRADQGGQARHQQYHRSPADGIDR